MTAYAASSTPSASGAFGSAVAARFASGAAAGKAGSSPGFAASLAEVSAPSAAAGTATAPLPATSLSRSLSDETHIRAAIHKSAQDFEAAALGQLMGFITQNIEVDPNFGGGHGEEMFRDLLNSEYGKMLHKSGNTGLARQVEGQLLRAQGLKPLTATVGKA